MSAGRQRRRAQPRQWPQLLDLARRLEKAEDHQQGVIIPGVSAQEIQSLGRDLYDIALGKDASVVFEQTGGKRGNQSDSVLNFNRSVRYWHARAKGKSINEAVLVAQEFYKRVTAPKRNTMLRYARANRQHVFDFMEEAGVDLTALKAELAKRSRQGKQ